MDFPQTSWSLNAVIFFSKENCISINHQNVARSSSGKVGSGNQAACLSSAECTSTLFGIGKFRKGWVR